jgi:predicted PurR-regulated permease PerM
MHQTKRHNTNSKIALNGAYIAIAAVFAYSLLVMLYAIIRSSASIYNIMPPGERISITWANGISIAYAAVVFSMVLALISSIPGAVSAVILKKLLMHLNPSFNQLKAALISCGTAVVLLTTMYFLLYAMLKDWMTFRFPETFLCWYLFPAVIFFVVTIIGGNKLNKALQQPT